MSRKFMFLYLNSGNGHISSAKVIRDAINEVDPSAEVELVNGFDKTNIIGHLAFEKFYAFACNVLHGAFPLVYDLTQPRWALSVVKFFVNIKTKNFLKETIREKGFTDVVSFHFGLTPAAFDAIQELKQEGINVNLNVMCTDPFTAHHAWFYYRNVNYMVCSQQAKDIAINECGVKEELIHIVPFLISKKFREPCTPEMVKELRRKYGFDENKKVVLLAGGGEGLPGALKIVNQCVIHKTKFAVAVVCGRNKQLMQSLEILKKADPDLDLHIFGFVDYMDSLIKLSDLVVSKGGPATLLEIVSCHKPVIINGYIHNQELGNMHFVTRNHLGYFIRHSNDIFHKIKEIFESDEIYDSIVDKTNHINIDIDNTKTARYLLGM